MSSDLRGKLARGIDLLAEFGPEIGLPHVRSMGEGLFELRMKGRGTIARVFFCLVVGRVIVFLHVFIKMTEKTPARELQIALRRMKEVRHAP